MAIDNSSARLRVLVLLGFAVVIVVGFTLRSRQHSAPSTGDAERSVSAESLVEEARRLARSYGAADPVVVDLILGGVDFAGNVDVHGSDHPGGGMVTFASRATPLGSTALIAIGSAGMTGSEMPAGTTPVVEPATCGIGRFLGVARMRGLKWNRAMVAYGLLEPFRHGWRLSVDGRALLEMTDRDCTDAGI